MRKPENRLNRFDKTLKFLLIHQHRTKYSKVVNLKLLFGSKTLRLTNRNIETVNKAIASSASTKHSFSTNYNGLNIVSSSNSKINFSLLKMALVKTCCGYWELKEGAKNIAIISIFYDVAMAAGLLLVLCIYVPFILWEDRDPIRLVYKIMLIVSICIRFLHLIPSFLLLYSTWEEIQRGVPFWLFAAYIDILLHGAWIAVPFVMHWKFDMIIILVVFLILSILIAFYFISVVASYLAWVKERDQDIRARRRLKEFY